MKPPGVIAAKAAIQTGLIFSNPGKRVLLLNRE
jgi:hypothetical protein